MAVAIVLALLCGLLLGRKFSPASPTKAPTSSEAPAPAAVMTVTAISPTIQTVSDHIDANGVIVGKDVARVGARVSGVAIEQIFVQEGDRVQQGDVLAQLDGTLASSQIEGASAELAAAQATLAKAQADLTRVAPLLEIDAISRQQYDGFVTAKEQAAAQVVALQARLAGNQTALKNTQVVAPVSGIVSARHAQVGELSTGGALFEIVKDGVWQWQASLSPAMAEAISVGQAVQVFPLNGAEPVSALVARIAPTADAGRQLGVFATLTGEHSLTGGMYVAGRFLLTQKSVPMLPYQAVTFDDGAGYVWTLTPAKEGLYQVKRTQISADQTDDGVAVALPLDTLVVKEGGNFLKDGDLVRVTGEGGF